MSSGRQRTTDNGHHGGFCHTDSAGTGCRWTAASRVLDDFRTLEVLNVAAKERYVGMGHSAQKLVSHTAILQRGNDALAVRIKQIGELESAITQLEALVKDLAGFTKRILDTLKIS
ncbi:hypothetical protein BC831DRAFT_165881 [Entophlyctis helioformis]|nr:hypothetical protein BC831DRAFT_165881 [Entophlyctis helioformis]